MNPTTTTVTVGAHEYSVGKLDAVKQFHIVRRLSPVLTELKPLLTQVMAAQKTGKAVDLKNVNPFEALVPVVNLLSKMEDDEADKILFGLLACIQRKQQGGGYSPVIAVDCKSLMFSDLDMPEMLQLCAKALMQNLGNFLAALPSVSPGANQKQNGQA